jgi:large subunit ribosomal protein L16
MQLVPKRVKYRKSQRGRNFGVATKGDMVNFGEFGLKAIENSYFSSKQIEAARVAIQRKIVTAGKLFIRIFPDKPVTKKPAETRMGKGKGAPEGWVARIKRGRVLFELEGIPRELAHDAFRLAAYKIPFRTKFVARHTV